MESISPSDGGSLTYLSNLLTKSGFTCYLKEFGDNDQKTTNLYAEKGGKGKNLCFAGHVDVVPPGNINSWSYNPFEMTELKGKVYGRGVVDMKGAVSAMVHAIIDYSDQYNGVVSLLLTSDEEASGKFGTKEMLKWIKNEGIKIDFAIVGEPTSNKIMGDIIKIGRRGSLNCFLRIKGKQGHVAYPALAINPNNILIKILHELNLWQIDEGNEYFQPSNLEVISIDVDNDIMNIIPESACAKFNIRFNNIQTQEKLSSRLHNICAKYSTDYILDTNVSAEVFFIKKTEFIKTFQNLVSSICEVETKFSTSGGTSDARFLKDICPLLEFGLLNKTAHQVDEYCEITDLQKLYTVYYSAIKSYHEKD